MTRLLALPLIALVAACGIKGDPEPVETAPKVGLTISGTAGIGVTHRSGG